MAKVAKYRNKKTTVDGITFDSKAEAARYKELAMMQRAGIIDGLTRQVEFELIPKQSGERSCNYIADFVYTENGERIVEDCKGMKTPGYIIKRKLMKFLLGITVKETRRK